IRHATEGEAEGGLGVLARFMLGAHRPDAEQPAPAPAGVYWTATRTRGVWLPWHHAKDVAAAKAAVEDALTHYFAERDADATNYLTFTVPSDYDLTRGWSCTLGKAELEAVA